MRLPLGLLVGGALTGGCGSKGAFPCPSPDGLTSEFWSIGATPPTFEIPDLPDRFAFDTGEVFDVQAGEGAVIACATGIEGAVNLWWTLQDVDSLARSIVGPTPLYVGDPAVLWADQPVDGSIGRSAVSLMSDRFYTIVDCSDQVDLPLDAAAWFEPTPSRTSLHLRRTGTVGLSETGLAPCKAVEIVVDLVLDHHQELEHMNQYRAWKE